MGFIVGMELASGAWQPFFDNEEIAILVLPMLMLGKVSDDFEKLTEAEIRELRETMPDSVLLINSYWHENDESTEE